MMKMLLLAVSALALAGCTDPDGARHAAEQSGLKDVRPTSYRWFACGESDFYHTGFVAVNVNGQNVSGVVCSGLFFKAYTVRFD